MDFGEALFQSQFIRRDHVPALNELLARKDFSWLVTSPHESEERLQGDLFVDVPTVFMDQSGTPRSRPLPVMVINNTCDLQPDRSTFVTVAPASDYARFAAHVTRQRGTMNASGYLKSLNLNRIDQMLFIPGCPGFEQGIVIHLDRFCSMSAKVYDQALANGQRLASFSQSGFYYLLMKMTRFLARTETDEISPRTN